MSTIYLIRHAQASFGQPDYDQLSDLGFKQAQVLADRLINAVPDFDFIYTGLQVRHEQTLSAFLEAGTGAGKSIPEIKNTDAFNEYDAEKVLLTVIPELIREDPAFEGDVSVMMKDNRSFQKVYERSILLWINSTHTYEGLESWNGYSARVHAGIDAIMDDKGPGKRVAVFTSGGVISVSVQRALNLSDKDTLNLSWQIVNTSITRFKYNGSRLMLSGFNDFSHLESKDADGLITYR